MEVDEIFRYLAGGRTDVVFALLSREDWKELLHQGQVKPIQWLVYYDDLTAIKAIVNAGGNLSSISLDEELGNAAFFGHWKICEFLIQQGADVNYKQPETGETALHSSLCKAGRPYYLYTVKVLVEHGADVNAKTAPGFETGAFMRDVRTKGESPLHRAAAYASEDIIHYLIENGADKTLQDAHGNSPLSYASEHLRPGSVLSLLAYGDHRIGEAHKIKNKSDHGNSWGNGMDWNLYGDYLPLNG